MQLSDIKKIGVVGAGTMGAGIAQIAAMAGYDTLIFDIQEEAIQKAEAGIIANLDKGIEKGKVTEEQKKNALAKVSYTTQLETLQCDFIIEAIVEKLTVKVEVFKKLEAINSPKTILATNTSSIPITQIAAGLKHPERLVGMHFFNPAHIMKLVEVISGAATKPEIAAVTRLLAEKLGKKAVEAKDSPGFIVNRVARHFYVEGLKTVEEGVGEFHQIDRLMEASGFKMGPFRLMDLIGVDTNFSVTTAMYEQQKVDAGHHGKKSGKGFYDYQK
jgi:3-hydroxybutyryl-CoA dehydrogenase